MKNFYTQTLASVISISLAFPSSVLLAQDQPQTSPPEGAHDVQATSDREQDFSSFNDGDAKLSRVEKQLLTELGCNKEQGNTGALAPIHPDLLAERISRLDAVTYSHTLVNLAVCYVEQSSLRPSIEQIFDALYPKVQAHLHHANAVEAVQTEATSHWKVYVAIIGGLLIAKRAVNSALAAQNAEAGFFKAFAKNFLRGSQPAPKSTGSEIGDKALAGAAARDSLAKDMALESGAATTADDALRAAQSDEAARAALAARTEAMSGKEATEAGAKALADEASATRAMQQTTTGTAARAQNPLSPTLSQAEAEGRLASYVRDTLEPWKARILEEFKTYRAELAKYEADFAAWKKAKSKGPQPVAPKSPSVEPPTPPQVSGYTIERTAAQGGQGLSGVDGSETYIRSLTATLKRDVHQSLRQAELQAKLDQTVNASMFGPDAIATRLLQSRRTWIATIAGVSGARLLWSMRNHKMDPRPVLVAAKVTALNAMALKTYEVSDLADSLQEMIHAGAEDLDVSQAASQATLMDQSLNSVEQELQSFAKVEGFESLNDREVKTIFEQDPRGRQLLNELVDSPSTIAAQIIYARGVLRQIQTELNKENQK